MVIREMSWDECRRVLAGASVARLACRMRNQPYVVPVYLAYHSQLGGDECLYGFAARAAQVESMRPTRWSASRWKKSRARTSG